MVSLAFRNALQQMLRASGLHEVQARQVAFAGPGGFDLSSWKPRKAKAYRYPRPAEPDLIVVHVTDVTGGFGVSKRRVKAWSRALIDGAGERLPAGIFDQLPSGSNEDRARRLALWERYRECPYHQIGAANGDVICNHDLMRYSWHGNGGNRRGVGWALDVGHGQDLDRFMVETGRAALRALIYRMREDPIDVAPHRAYSAGRRVDTDALVWSMIIKPIVGEFDHVRIDYEARKGRGRPVPDRWDSDALYDWKGRRL